MTCVSRLSMLAFVATASLTSHAAGTFTARSVAVTPLSAGGGDETTVLRVSVPAGTWVVSSKVSFVNWSNKDYDRCRLLAGSTLIDGAATMTGELDGMPAVATLANLGAVTTSERASFKLQCWHDFAVPDQYIDPGAMLVVIRAPR
jgi:hypothetical protein